MRNRKKFVKGFAAIGLLTAIAAGGLIYYEVYHEPMLRARPILQGIRPSSSQKQWTDASWLVRGKQRDSKTGEYLSDPTLGPLEGVAAKKVKRQILNILSLYSEEDGRIDRDFAGQMLLLVLVVGLPESALDHTQTGLQFDGADEWDVIEQAVNLYAAKDEDRYSGMTFHIEVSEDGSRTLSMGGPVIP